jgi:AraC-like DNA-binding protein
MEQLHAIWSEKKSGYYARAMALFYEIISLFVKRQTEYLTPAQRLPLERAQEYLLAHYRTPDFSYAALGEASGVSYSYFKSLFLKQYGISPVRYVTRLRISYAKELLLTGRYTVGQIAAMCGFENTYYFSNVFKKETGCAPTLYVKRG